MNKITNKFLIAEDKFMPEMHFTQPGFTYSTCGRFAKNKERIKKFKEIKIQNMMDINGALLQWSINFLIKKLLVAVLKIFLIKNGQKNYAGQLLKNLIKEKYIHLL